MLKSWLLLLVSTPFLIAADWPIFRGGPAQEGVRTDKAPKKLDELWRYVTKNAIEGTPAIVNGVVYIGSFDDFLHAIDLKTGRSIWLSKTGPIKSSPAIKGDRIIVGDADGKVHCLELKTGKEIWTFETAGEITGGANFYKDLILIGSQDETLYCLDHDGKKRWEFKANGPVNGVPAVIGNKTFVAGCDSNLHILEIETGKELKSLDLGGPSGASAAVVGDDLFVGTMNNEVLDVNIKDESITWKFAAAKRQQPFYSSAAITDSLVILGSRDRKVYALDRKTGKEVWSYLTENRVDSSPIVVGDRIYIGSFDRTLYVLDLKGTEIDKIELDGAIIGSPAFADGKLVIGTEKGTVYCFGEK